MKITYTGRQVELAPAQLKKLQAQFAKIGKLLNGKRDWEVHVVLSQERHIHRAEATLHYYDHQLVGLGSGSDLYTAIHDGAEKLEKQVLKTRTKFRDNKRMPRKAGDGAEREQAAGDTEAETGSAPQVNKVIHQKRKPMTLDEAILQMDKSRDYVIYRDAETDRVSILVRRRDGNFDLVEG